MTEQEQVSEQVEETTSTQARRERIEEQARVVSGLSAMQRTFFVEYLIGGNATHAARVAGYAYPDKQGPRLLKNKKIQDAIDDFFHAQEMSAAEVVARLSDHARGTMEDFISFEGDLPSLDLGQAEGRGKLHLVKKMKTKRTTYIDVDGGETVTDWVDVELYDAQAALGQVGRYHGLFKDRTDLTSGDKPIQPITTIVVMAPAGDEVNND